MIEPEDKLAYVYKEYERLHGVVNAYSHSSFDDFKLLAALGLVFAWDPIMSLVKGQVAASEPAMLFVGFVVTLVLSAIIAVRDLLKQSLMIFNHLQLKAYEDQLRDMLSQQEASTFRGTENWRVWFRSSHAYVAFSFYGLYSFSIVAFSCAVLYWRTGWQYATLYLLVACATSIFPAFALRSLYARFATPRAADASAA